ncbi:MAG TPA: hypothetical protein VLJ60_01615 [bacterium]|nr:hypothetical protein [bacterium]
MRLVSVIFFAMIPVVFVSCGIARSTSSIWKAEDQRERSLGKITTSFEKTDIVETDQFGRKSLVRKAADEITQLEKRKAAYYFFKGDAYLSKAYDFRSKSIYDSSDFLAKKALEYFNEAEKIAGGEKPASVNVPEVKPEPAPVPVPVQEVKPAAPEVVKPVPVPTPAAEVKAEPAPAPVPTPAAEVKSEPVPASVPVTAAEVKAEPAPATPDPEEKPALKGDPFAEKKEEPKKAEPEKKEEKKPSYYDVYEEMRQKYLKKQSDEKEKEKQDDKKEGEKKEKKKDDGTAPQGGAK